MLVFRKGIVLPYVLPYVLLCALPCVLLCNLALSNSGTQDAGTHLIG
jgi:hypothetical protein